MLLTPSANARVQVSGAQYVSSALAFNFGHVFRAPWITNWRFLGLVLVYATVHLCMVLIPGQLSCFVRINCEAEDIVRGALSPVLVRATAPCRSPRPVMVADTGLTLPISLTVSLTISLTISLPVSRTVSRRWTSRIRGTRR